MARVLVFQHVPHEPLGILDPLLRRARHRIRYANFGRDPQHRVERPQGYAGLIVLGGPMNPGTETHAAHLDHEIEIIRSFLDADKPVLGICLGCQLLALAGGGRVFPAPVTEIGWHAIEAEPDANEDALFCHLPARSMVMQWHGMTYALPPGATRLARGDAVENQAFRLGDSAWGLQFHLECDAAVIERWLRVEAHAADLAREDTPGPDQIRADTATHLDAAMDIGAAVFGAFIARLPGVSRQPQLPSRD